MEPRLKTLSEGTTRVDDNLREILKLDKIMKHFQDANDEDGAFSDDIEIVPTEVSLYFGINLILIDQTDQSQHNH